MKSFLIDLDGVLYVGKEIVNGAKECLKLLENLGYHYRFVSNSTRRSRRSVAERLKSLGYDIPAEQIFTPSLAAIEHINRSMVNRCFLLTTGDVNSDFESSGIIISEENVNFVIVGDAGKDFTYERLNKALTLY
ncbi:MAG: hypothetical protein LUQ38_09525 [Methanotrichaceae archaeon]|nr:hypothetical protein [Methanotrichaceae archaeon]